MHVREVVCIPALLFNSAWIGTFMATWVRRNYRILLLLVSALALLPSYLWAYALIAPSESPTLNIGDRIIVNKAAYALRLPYANVTLFRTRSPKRGDMVLVLLPSRRAVAPKRVVGLPEETIELRENRVLVKGRELPVRPLNRVEFDWVNPSNRIGSVVLSDCLTLPRQVCPRTRTGNSS